MSGNIIILKSILRWMQSTIQVNGSLLLSNIDLPEMESFQSSQSVENARAATAPSRPFTDLEEFKRSKVFKLLEQTVLCSNQLIHKSYDKFDVDSAEGQEICEKYLGCLEKLCLAYHIKTANREYRTNFSQAYKVLYKDGQLSYLTEILDSAQQAFPHLYVNGEKYSFSQEVLQNGSNLMAFFFKVEHNLRDFYAKVTQETANFDLDKCQVEVKHSLLEFDIGWSSFEKLYVMELMSIEVKARSLITRAIEAEQCLTSVEIRQKMKGKILMNCEDYLSTRAKLCEIVCEINQTANYVGKGRDDLDHSILCETQGLLRRVTRDQSKAIRILGEKIRNSFSSMRTLLRKYSKNIEMIDPQLKNNSDLVEILVQYQKSWQKGGNYFCDTQKRRHLLHFSGTIEGISQKYPKFKQMVQCSDAGIFLIIPCILLLKSLDKDDKNLCKYFLPSLNQIDTQIFRIYFSLQKEFQEWKRNGTQHYSYYNILQKQIIGIKLTPTQQERLEENSELLGKITSKIRYLGNELHRYDPTEWNSFMEICLAGAMDG